MKKCKYCQSEIDEKAKICHVCKKDLRNFFQQHIIFTLILILIGLGIIISNSAMLRLNSDSTGTGKLTSEATSKEIQREYIKSGEIIKTKDWEVKISEVKFGQRINPSIQPMFYTYYQVKDTNNTYLCVILEAKNNSTLDLGADEVATVKIKYNNKYTYTSFSAIEDANLGFTYTNIKPLTSRRYII